MTLAFKCILRTSKYSEYTSYDMSLDIFLEIAAAAVPPGGNGTHCAEMGERFTAMNDT